MRTRTTTKASGSRDPRYDSPKWRALSREVIAQHPWCQGPCAGVRRSRFCDHIKAERDGGAFWDRDNLQALCSRCHGQKSRVEQGERGDLPKAKRMGPVVVGCDAAGMPLDPNHPWNRE